MGGGAAVMLVERDAQLRRLEAALLARLGVSSRHDALAVATDLGLLDPPAGEP